MPPSLLEIAWSAGFLDGEGCFTASITAPRRRERSPRFNPRVTVSQVDRRPLDRLKDLYGGCIHGQKASVDTWRDAWVWNLQGKDRISNLLTSVLPYLLVKDEQAKILLELCDRLAGASVGQRPILTQDEIDIRTEIVHRLRATKKAA